MFKNYLKIAARNILKSKFYTAINITGLSIGLCCVILISLFVRDELSYDRFHENHENIYALTNSYETSTGTSTMLSNFFPLGNALKEQIPGIDSYVNITSPFKGKISSDGNNFTEEDRIIASTEGFFTMFNFPLAKGDKNSVLASPGTVVISSKIADKYFPNQDPVGKTLTIDRLGIHDYVVTGIADNPPSNSYLTFDAVISIEGLSSTKYNRTSWNSNMYPLFVKLDANTSWDQISNEANQVQNINRGSSQREYTLSSVPLSDLYLSDLVRGVGFKGDYQYIYLFSAIALFILLLACINYMNLSTAKSMKRGLEVGIRKSLGANKKQLINQFLGESIIIAFFALILAIFLSELLLPLFNSFFDKELALFTIQNLPLITAFVCAALFVGIISGSYPAFFLSGLKPVGILKNQKVNPGGVNLRKGLVALQFTISSVLIISTIVVLNQLRFIQNKDLGFEASEVMYIAFNGDDLNSLNSFKSSMESHTAISSVSYANGIPGRFCFGSTENFDPLNPEKEIAASLMKSDSRYLETLGLNLLAGRYIDENRASDAETGIVVNETMVKELGLSSPQEAVGKQLANGDIILGVVNDFHFKSLKSQIQPVIIQSFSYQESPFSGCDILVARFDNDRLGSLIPFLKAEWNDIVGPTPFTAFFLNDQLKSFYEVERKLGNAFSFFAVISILIACLGLFGLAAFAAQLRIKEIGIRKVLGATVSRLMGLLTYDFLKLVIIGFIISVPVSWYLMSLWLKGFAYHTGLGIQIFVISGLLTILISISTVSLHTVRASLSNPIDSLKNE